MILTDDQKNRYHQVWKEIFKNVNDGNGELMLHEKIRLIDSNFPIEKIFKIHSITIVNKSLIEKDNKFYLELHYIVVCSSRIKLNYKDVRI